MIPNYDDYDYDKQSWEHKAMPALWRRADKPDIQLDTTPSIGSSYRINVPNGNLRNGDEVKVEYLPALTHYNGFDDESDISRFRICEGILSNVSHRKDEGNIYKSYTQDAILLVKNTFSILDFTKLSQPKTFGPGWADMLSDRLNFMNLSFNGPYIIWNWNSEGYIGETYILTEQNGKYYALYGIHAEGVTECAFGGKVELPKKVSDLLRDRLRG